MLVKKIFCLLYLFYAAVVAFDLGDTEKMTDKLGALTTTTSDIFTRLKFFGDNTDIFLKAIASASPVIMAFATIGFDAESAELQAIKKLRTDIFNRFDALSNEHTRLVLDLKMFAMKMAYNEKITTGLLTMKRVVKESILLIDDTAKPSLTDFIDKVCKPDAPKKMLDWMRSVTFERCRPIDNRRIEMSIQVQDLFENAEIRFQNFSYSDTEEYVHTKFHTLNYIVNQQTHIEARDTILRLTRAFKKEHSGITPQKAVSILVRNVYGLSFGELVTSDLCLLSLTFLGNDYRRTPLNHLYQIMLDDLSFIEMYAGLCNRAQNQGSTARANHLDRLLSRELKDVVDSMTVWMRFSLEQSWAHVWHRVAKAAIGQDDLPGDVANYQRIAFEISHELIDVGPDKFLTQVLISESCGSWEGTHCDFVPDCGNDRLCTYIRNFKKVNVAMMRYEVELAIDKSEHAGIWFKSHLNDLKAAIKTHYDTNSYLSAENKHAYWRQVLKGVERDVPGVRSSAYYQSRMIMHINVPLDYQTVIRAKWVNHQIGMQAFNGSTSFEIHVDPAIENAFRMLWINFL